MFFTPGNRARTSPRAAFTLIKPLVAVVFLSCLLAVVTQMYVSAVAYAASLS